METFTWLHDRDASVETDFNLREVQLGNGVVQVQRQTLGKPKRTFDLTFVRSVAEINQIETFLVRNHGKRFIWQRAGGNIKVRCTAMKRTETGLADTLSCTFVEELF